jgi:DNA repair protein RadC
MKNDVAGFGRLFDGAIEKDTIYPRETFMMRTDHQNEADVINMVVTNG